MLLTGLLFACVTGVIRYLGSDMPAIQGAFIRYAIGTLMIAPLLLRNWTGIPERKTLQLYAARALIHGVAVILWFFAMARVPMAEVTALGYVVPIFVTIGAALFLGERLHLRRLFGVGAGFVGAMVIVRPGFEEVNLGQLAQLSAAPLFAASFIIAKKLTVQENSFMIVGLLSVGCTLTLLPGAILQWRSPTVEEMGWLSLSALLATTGHFTLTKAFAAAPNGFYDANTAERLVKYLFMPRNSIDPGEAYRSFRGRDANIEPLMRDRGFPIPSKNNSGLVQ